MVANDFNRSNLKSLNFGIKRTEIVTVANELCSAEIYMKVNHISALLLENIYETLISVSYISYKYMKPII